MVVFACVGWVNAFGGCVLVFVEGFESKALLWLKGCFCLKLFGVETSWRDLFFSSLITAVGVALFVFIALRLPTGTISTGIKCSSLAPLVVFSVVIICFVLKFVEQ